MRGKPIGEDLKTEIREKLAETPRMSLQEIADMFHVGKTTVHRIAAEEAAKYSRCTCGAKAELDDSGRCLKCRVDSPNQGAAEQV